MDPIKGAFNKVKEELSNLKIEINEIKKELNEIQFSILNLIKNKRLNNQIQPSTDRLNNSTDIPKNTTDLKSSTDSSTDKYHFKGLKDQKILFSIGNDGVSTDRQTDRQTDTSTHILNPSLVLSQLDSFKKGLRLKIKRLTNQEMLVYSTIYQFDNQGHDVDYLFLSNTLSLTESSIRDYVQRIFSKGLPLIKEKVNNKRILLRIPTDLHKLASLDTILKLRNL